MKLEDLLNRIPVLETLGDTNREVSALTFDSRKAVENSLYVAIKGTVSNGHDFINNAIQNGANVIVCEEFPNEIKEDITYLKVLRKSVVKTKPHRNYRN